LLSGLLSGLLGLLRTVAVQSGYPTPFFGPKNQVGGRQR